MTSSSEIHVQEVLNNLVSATNSMTSIKRDGIENLDESFTAVISAAQAQQTSAQQAQEQHDQQQANQSELERIAQEHQHQAQEHGRDQGESGLSTATEEASVIHVNALETGNTSTLATVPINTTSSAPPPAKPVTGSEEWHKMRRDNHKEVERRRRETINAGINDLASVIPNPDKNKGAILRQAVKYIHTIQEAHQKALADSEALVTMQFERERAMLEKGVAQTQLQALLAEHEQLKRDYEALRKEYDEMEESKKRQRTE